MEVGVLDEADGSAMVETGNTRVVASVFGPQKLHPRHLQESDRAVIKMRYNMAPFSVDDRMRPGPNRRAKRNWPSCQESSRTSSRTRRVPKGRNRYFNGNTRI